MRVSITTVLEKIKAGDDRYFSILVKEYSPMLMPIASFHLMSAYNRAKDIEDALQETWTKVYRYLDTLADPQKFSGWLVKILRHECLRIQDKNKKYISMHLLIDPETREDLQALIQDDEPGDEQNLSSGNIRQVTTMVLNNIDEIYALPLKLFYLEGYSLKHISALLSISENLVKTRLFRGRQILKKEFRKEIKHI